MQAASKTPDEFQARYIIVFLLPLLLSQTSRACAVPGSSDDPGIIWLLLYIFCLMIYFSVALALSVLGRSWRRLASVLIAPFTVIGILQAEFSTGLTPDYARFLLHRSEYMTQVRNNGPGPVFYAWLWDRTWGVGRTQTQTILIYDKTDQVLLPPGSRTIVWLNEVKSFRSAENLDLRSLESAGLGPVSYFDQIVIAQLTDHFYLVSMRT